MVKRYEHEDKCSSEYNCGFYECSTGDYVEYADYEKLVDALDWIKGATDIKDDRCICGRLSGVLAIHNHAKQALEAEK